MPRRRQGRMAISGRRASSPSTIVYRVQSTKPHFTFNGYPMLTADGLRGMGFQSGSFKIAFHMLGITVRIFIGIVLTLQLNNAPVARQLVHHISKSWHDPADVPHGLLLHYQMMTRRPAPSFLCFFVPTTVN